MKTFKELREALEGYVSAAQRKAVWASRADGGEGHPDNKKAKKEDAATDKAVKDFLAKGGKIKKLAPGKAAGYHGKDDPGKGMAGMMDKGDTKQIGTRKKVKSMESAEVKEISKKTLGTYIKKATSDIDDKSYDQGHSDAKGNDAGNNATLNKRRRGINKAVNRLMKPEGYKSYAQQKAVWASRADAKKGKK